MACSTELAVATKEGWINRDPRADSHFGPLGADSLRNVTAYGDNLARELVTGHDRIGCWWKLALGNVQVGSADAAGTHPYDKFVRPGSRIGDIPHPNLTRFIDDSSAHGYTSLVPDLFTSMIWYDYRFNIGTITPGCLQRLLQ